MLRAAVMTPYMNDKEEFDVYAPKIQAAFTRKKLEQIYDVK